MIGWLKNTNGIEKKKVEPGATFSALEDHWKQITEVMENSLAQDSDGAEAVISHLGQMISFLRMARVDSCSENTCKVFWLQNKCCDKVIKWLHYLQIQGVQFPAEIELKLVTMLQSLCEVASKDGGELLGYAKGNESTDDDNNESWDDGAYSLASLLLEYSLRNEGTLGEIARHCFLLLIQLASKISRLQKNLTQGPGRGLTNVVISGLSACFSTLPTFTHSSRDQIRAFTTQLRFVDEVCKASSPSVVATISDCFTNAFLLSVIQPAMTQSLHEEIAMVTYYFQIVCEHLTNPYLIRSLVLFTNANLLPVLIQRISHPNVSVVVATLRLFHVLFEFYCEDFWYETILRYLVPENHLMISQRHTQLRDTDFHESSIRILSLVPGNVMDSVGSDVLTTHYLKYLSSESQRFMDIVLMVTDNTNTVPISFHASMTDKDNEDEESRQSNLIYPLWKFKYDGTDEVTLVKSLNVTNKNKRELETRETGLANGTKHADVDPLTLNVNTAEELTTVYFDENTNLNDTGNPIDISAGNELPSMERLAALSINDEIGNYNIRPESPDSSDGLPSHQIASFGGFLDGIFVQLSNWPYLDPQVILVLTELVSTIAASRIPLITSLLIDNNLTLQPYYITFTSLLKRIQSDLEYHMKMCPSSILLEAWNNIDDTNDDGRRRSSVGLSASLTLNSSRNNKSTPPSFSNSDNFGEKIIKGTTILSSAMQSFFGRKSSSSTSPAAITSQNQNTGANNSRNNSPSTVRPVGPQEMRYTIKNQNDDEAKRQMALRTIYFAHWVFELAAIAQQLSWKNI